MWANSFIKKGRDVYQIVKLKTTGNSFTGNAYNCFEGTTDKEYNLKESFKYWDNLNEDETKINANILDKAELKQFYEPSVSPIIKLIIIYGSLTLVIIFLRYTQQIFFLTASMRLTLDIRKDAFNKLKQDSKIIDVFRTAN